MEEGEFIEEDSEVFLSEKIGKFTTKRRYHQKGLGIEEILEFDVMKETKLDIDSSISDSFKKYSEKYGFATNYD